MREAKPEGTGSVGCLASAASEGIVGIVRGPRGLGQHQVGFGVDSNDTLAGSPEKDTAVQPVERQDPPG